METKICLQCEKAFIPKRSDAKFCSSTCKAKHWDKVRVEKESISVADSLRGVINETSSTSSIYEIKSVTKAVEDKPQTYQEHIQKINELKTSEKRLEEEIKRLKENLHSKKQDKRIPSSLHDTAFGLQIRIERLDVSLTSIKRQLIGLSIRMLGMTFFKTDSTPFVPLTNISVDSVENKIEKIINNKLSETKVATQNIASKPNLSQKIISSRDLKSMNYNALSFQGKWFDFFGYPSINFHCVIHGMSGEGKSTFAVQFANYLAENFGTVLYISGEEGFSKTFKDKFINNNAFADGLSVADLRNFDSIIKEVQINTFNFIFIDSLDNMKIDAHKMKELREHYKDSSIITISQSTKDGKMRGSYEIVHDSDIAVRVENGIATTTKNRFKEKGMQFGVFS
jgi:predicted ATP-dependent serine protease